VRSTHRQTDYNAPLAFAKNEGVDDQRRIKLALELAAKDRRIMVDAN
jgi:hypothetical protein